MSMIGLKIPAETAGILSEIKLPGSPATDLHITILHLGDALPISTISKAVEVAYEVVQKIRPFTVQTTKVICFSEGKNGVPVVCEIESEALHELWAKLCEAFDEAGLEYSKKFPVYRPHVTLSWAEAPIKPIKFSPIEWGAHELTVWGGDSGERKVMVSIPITPFGRAARSKRVAFGLKLTPPERVALKFQLTQAGIWE